MNSLYKKVTQAALLRGPIAAAIVAAYGLYKSYSPTIDTKKIVILGDKGAGKTTLWNCLKNEDFSSYDNVFTTTNPNDIDEFVLKAGERKVRILKTKDIGGSNESFMTHYKELIDSTTFIYYLIDVNELLTNEEKARHAQGRMAAILMHIKDILEGQELEGQEQAVSDDTNGFIDFLLGVEVSEPPKQAGFGFKILLTCYNALKSRDASMAEKAKVIQAVMKCLKTDESKLMKSQSKDLHQLFELVELRDPKDIAKIKNAIVAPKA